MIFLNLQLFSVGGNSPGSFFDDYLLSDNFFELGLYDEIQGFDRLLAGIINQPAQTDDEDLTEQVTNLLFKAPGAEFGTDLASLNIQRGRDHGLASYGAVREECGLQSRSGQPELCSWDDRIPEIPQDRWDKLRAVYEPTGNPPSKYCILCT